MENIKHPIGNQKGIEQVVLILYSIYSVAMIAMAAAKEWESWTSLFLLVAVATSWIVSLSKFKDFVFRTRYIAAMMQVSIFLYAHQAEDLAGGLPVFIAFVVFAGLYEMVDVLYMTMVSAAIIFFYHGMILDTIPWETTGDILLFAAQVGNVATVEFVVWLWVKRRNESSSKMLHIIEDLRDAENSKDEFLANVSHEIRTPINTICGMSELVLREDLPYAVKENVLSIQSAGRNLISVVSDILDFSELQSGKMELEEESYNIASTINDVINMALARRGDKKIELIVDCDPAIPSGLYGDEKKLRRVILNLMDNAIKFTETGGIFLQIGFRRESYGVNLIIVIKDTGIGISEESLEKMFNDVHQVDASTRRAEGGLGLGLIMSHALVRKMKGVINIKSKLGKGTTVRFVIPQTVVDETPIASLQDRSNISVATYIDMEQFDMVEIRDEYTNVIINMVQKLNGKCHICRNFAELQRRVEKENFSHVFTSTVEYRQYKDYFDALSEKTNVVVVLNQWEEKYIVNQKLLKIYKPFYILSVVSVLNGSANPQGGRVMVQTEKFTVKDAHILVVDDNRVNIRVVEGLLSHYNIKVTVANSGHEALEKVQNAFFDFIFMDHMMPEMDGVETMHRIRQKVGTYFQKVPIIALTANAVAGTREMLIKEGFNDFLEKPIERSVLERVLKRNISPEKIVNVEEEKRDNQHAALEKQDALEEQLKEIGIDMKKGILYCNGKEAYLEILKAYCAEWKKHVTQLQEFLETADWKNYTITVHGMKSSLGSIGASELSELAKQSELAGKEQRIDYIKAQHGKLLEMYTELFTKLRNIKEFAVEETQEDSESQIVTEQLTLEAEPIGDTEFEAILTEMETAMYSLDGEKLTELLDKLKPYQYRGALLEDAVAQAKRKVEMSDYISAVELIVKRKKKLTGEEK